MQLRNATPVLTLAVALALAGCGGGDASPDAADPTATTSDAMGDMDDASDSMGDMASMSDSEPMGEMSSDSMDGMDMGDADATPAHEMEGADLAQGDFALLDGAPEGFADASGTAWLARGDFGTVATVEVTGLAPDTAYVSHVHAESCATAGGPHYRFDPDGGDMPPNEIHLGFTTDAEGVGVMTATNEMRAGDDAVSVVIHQGSGDMTKALCADLDL